MTPLERAKQLIAIKDKADAPNYNRVGNASLQRCGTCSHFTDNGRCDLYNFKANAMYTCDSWRPDIERLKKARMTSEGETTKEVSAAATAAYAHGPGGLLSPAGMGNRRHGVVSAAIYPNDTTNNGSTSKPKRKRKGSKLAAVTTKPGDKYRSLKDPALYERLVAKGMPKSQAAAISNAMAKRGKRKVKDAAVTTKTLGNNIRNIVEAKIHLAYTTALDELFLRGYMERDDRLAVAGMIGDLLKQFGEKLDETIGKRLVEADAVAWIAGEKDTAVSLLDRAIALKHVSHDQKTHGARHGVQGLREFAKKRGFSIRDRGEGANGGRYDIRGGSGAMRASGITRAKKLISSSNRFNREAERKSGLNKKRQEAKTDRDKQSKQVADSLPDRSRKALAGFKRHGTTDVAEIPGATTRSRKTGLRVTRPGAAAVNALYDAGLIKRTGVISGASGQYQLALTNLGRQVHEWLESNKEQKTQPTTFTVFKDKTGRYRWVAISSTAYRDRDGEILSTKALADDIAHADTTGQYGTLRWWHVPGMDLGDCDFNMLYGRSLIESGTFKNDRIAERVKEKAHLLKLSLGFRHPANEPDKSGVFHTIRRFERSLIPPEGNASNLFTSLSVV